MEEKIKIFIEIVNKILDEVITDKKLILHDEEFKFKLTVCISQIAEDYFIKKNSGEIKYYCVKDILIKHLKHNTIEEIEVMIELSLKEIKNSSKKNVRRIKIQLLKLCLITTKI